MKIKLFFLAALLCGVANTALADPPSCYVNSAPRTYGRPVCVQPHFSHDDGDDAKDYEADHFMYMFQPEIGTGTDKYGRGMWKRVLKSGEAMPGNGHCDNGIVMRQSGRLHLVGYDSDNDSVCVWKEMDYTITSPAPAPRPTAVRAGAPREATPPVVPLDAATLAEKLAALGTEMATGSRAYTDQAVAAVALPQNTRMRADGALVTETLLPRDVCPPHKVRKVGGIGSRQYECTEDPLRDDYNPALVAEVQSNQIRGLTDEVAGAVRQPTHQPYELMLGAGATGVMDLGGALVAVGDMVWGSESRPLGLVLHGELGDMSDGQGLFGCAAVGVAKPMPGTTTTVGVLGGWCGSENADLDGTNFWHVDVQVRHRLLANWLAVGLDLKGGALWREKIVNQSVREVRDPAAALTFSAQVNF